MTQGTAFAFLGLSRGRALRLRYFRIFRHFFHTLPLCPLGLDFRGYLPPGGGLHGRDGSGAPTAFCGRRLPAVPGSWGRRPTRGRGIGAPQRPHFMTLRRRVAADDASLFSRARWGVGIIGIFHTSSTLPRFAFRRPLWRAFRSREGDCTGGTVPALLGALCAGACRDSEFVDFSLFARSLLGVHGGR